MICTIVNADTMIDSTINNTDNNITIIVDQIITFTSLIDNSTGIFFVDLNNCGNVSFTTSDITMTTRTKGWDCVLITPTSGSPGTILSLDRYEISPSFQIIDIIIGTSKEEFVNIKNNNDEDLNMTISLNRHSSIDAAEWIKVDETNFLVDEEHNIRFDIDIPFDAEEGSYTVMYDIKNENNVDTISFNLIVTKQNILVNIVYTAMVILLSILCIINRDKIDRKIYNRKKYKKNYDEVGPR